MSFIAWPSWCSLEAQWGAEREPRNPKRTQADPPGRAMSRGFPFLPRDDYSPVLAFHAELHNRAGFCTGRSDVQCVTQREGKKPCPSPYPKIPPKATGLSHAYFQSHLADSRTGFTRSVRSYPPIPI